MITINFYYIALQFGQFRDVQPCLSHGHPHTANKALQLYGGCTVSSCDSTAVFWILIAHLVIMLSFSFEILLVAKRRIIPIQLIILIVSLFSIEVELCRYLIIFTNCMYTPTTRVLTEASLTLIQASQAPCNFKYPPIQTQRTFYRYTVYDDLPKCFHINFPTICV